MRSVFYSKFGIMQENMQSGLLTEIHCQLDFSKFGIVLYAPITPDSRADFIADVGNTLLKIQCKTANESADGKFFVFSVISSNWNTKKKKNYQGQIDYFYTCHKGQGYLVPVEETGRDSKTLRLESYLPNNPNINWAKDYEIEKVLLKLNPDLKLFVPHKSTNKKEKTASNKTNHCIDCGVEISSQSVRCKACESERRTLEMQERRQITRSELKNMIRTESFLSIARKYQVSDSAIRKWCVGFNLPRTKREINSYTDEEWNKI